MEITREWARESLIKYANTHESICETLREIYDIIHKAPDSEIKRLITDKLIDAMIMGKKMQDRLYYYRDNFITPTGNNGKNLREIPDHEERQQRRSLR